MKNILVFAFAILANLGFANTPTAESSLPCKKVMLNAGTLVILECNESLFSGAVTPGKMVQMRVRTNVFAEGKVAIVTGAQAIGRVKSVEPGSFNTPESVTIELFYVQTVDGQQAPLNGNEQTFQAANPNEGATPPANFLITSQIMNDIEVKVN